MLNEQDVYLFHFVRVKYMFIAYQPSCGIMVLKFVVIAHYCRRALCRVLRALGKAPIALGKGFAECRTQQ